MKGKDLLSVSDLSSGEVDLLLSDTMNMKTRGWVPSLSGRSLALLFEKPSLRTRVSFEVAMRQLGGHTIYLSPAEVGLGERESIPWILGDGANCLQGCDEVSDGKNRSGRGGSFRMCPNGLSGSLFCRETGTFSIS